MKVCKRVLSSLIALVSVLIVSVLCITLVEKVNSKPKKQEDNTASVKPISYTFKAGEVNFVEGAKNQIVYSYNPDESFGVFATAYEYDYFNSFSNNWAAHVKANEVEGVSVSYLYNSNEPVLTSNGLNIEQVTSYTRDITQLVKPDQRQYIYVVIAPEDISKKVEGAITDIEEKFAQAKNISVVNNINSEVEILPMFPNGSLEMPLTPTAPEGYYFDGWFKDAKNSEKAQFPVQQQNLAYNTPNGLYISARFHNLPLNTTQYTVFNNGAYVLKSVPEVENLIIPSTYNDGVHGEAEIKVIGSAALKDSSVKTVCLPSSLIEIGESAFENCDNITSIDLTACVGLQKIGKNAFTRCNNLENVVMSNSVIQIGDGAFARCEKLTNVTLSTALQKMGKDAFAYSSIYSLRLPQSLTEIGAGAFQQTPITNITLPRNLTQVADNLFYSCSNLTSLAIPSKVTRIGDNAFYYCVGLTEINFNASASLMEIGESAFRGCGRLTNLSIPDKIETIGANAFSDCVSVERVLVSNNIKSIGQAAFNNCVNLINIVGLDSCSNLKVIAKNTFNNCAKLTNVLLPSSLTTIGDKAFNGCSSLTRIDISSNITQIGKGAFNGCSGLISLVFSNSNKWYRTTSSEYVGGENVVLASVRETANLFANEKGYNDYYWYKK